MRPSAAECGLMRIYTVECGNLRQFTAFCGNLNKAFEKVSNSVTKFVSTSYCRETSGNSTKPTTTSNFEDFFDCVLASKNLNILI